MPLIEKIQFQRQEVETVSNQELDNLLEANPKLFIFALNHYLNREFRSWEEAFPEHSTQGLRLQARASHMADLPHNYNSDGV